MHIYLKNETCCQHTGHLAMIDSNPQTGNRWGLIVQGKSSNSSVGRANPDRTQQFPELRR